MQFSKQPPIVSKKYRKSAKWHLCTMNLPGVCNYDPEKTILAHSEEPEDNQGGGQKSHDLFGAYICSDCHDVYDNRVNHDFSREYLRDQFYMAMKKTQILAYKEGIIKL